MAGVLARIGQETKSLALAAKSLQFSAFGGNYGSYGMGGYGIGFNGGLGWNLPGSQFEDTFEAGALQENPVVGSILRATRTAFAQAFPYLENFDGKAWKRVDDHLLLDKLNTPNDAYGGNELFGVTLECTLTQRMGAYWRFERDRRGQVAEIWYEPPAGIGPTGMAPIWDKTSFVKEYVRFVDGVREDAPIELEDAVHFRQSLDVANPRVPGFSLGLGAREITVINSGSTYTAAILRNNGTPAGFVSLDSGGLASATAPTPEQAESLKAHIEAKYSGPQNAGKIFVSPLNWKWNKVGMSPADLRIDAIMNMPIAIIAALLGTPLDVALLQIGERPTYENLDASMRWWWDNTITPTEDAFSNIIKAQAFPAFGLDPKEWRLMWDRSNVPALQEDVVAKNTTIAASYTAGVIDLYTAQTERGIADVPEAYKGVFHPSATAGNPQSAPLTPEEIEKQKRLQAAVKIVDANGMHHDEEGKYASGSFDAAHAWTGDAVPEKESKEFQDGKKAALEKLLPYTKPGGVEAASVVLKRDGSEYKFEVGNEKHVWINVPDKDEDEPVALLHSQTKSLAPSPDDWQTFLSSRNIEQSHTVNADATHSLYKPHGWSTNEPITLPDIESVYAEATIAAFNRAEDRGIMQTEEEESDDVMREVAAHYGVLWRIGKRK